MANLAFIGLGTMGFPMAGHLVRGGHQVAVFNRTNATAQRWLAEHPQGTVHPTPAAAAARAEVVLLCVGNDEDVLSVTTAANGVLQSMAPGSLLIDHTTASRELAQTLGKAAAAQGIGFVDAPVSGGQAGAENGQLTVMCGGSDEDFAAADQIFGCYAKTSQRLGAVGSGQLAKMVNQICIAGVLQGLSEALNFAQRSQLEVEPLVEALAGGAAQSWQMVNRAGTMAQNEFEFGFAVDWMRKDLGIALAEASRIGASLPVTALVDQFYAQVQAQGGGRLDTSSLIKRLR